MMTNIIQAIHTHKKNTTNDIEKNPIDVPKMQYGNVFVYTVICIGLVIIIGSFFL